MFNEEASKLRREINQLKAKLLEVEGDSLSEEEKADLCCSTSCGHDLVLSNLQKLSRDYNLKSLAVMACWKNDPEQNSNRWYSTNVSPDVLPYYLRSVGSIIEFLTPVFNTHSLQILEYLVEVEREGSLETMSKKIGMKVEDVKETIHLLERNDFLGTYKGDWSLTNKGWQTYIVLGHLTYVLDIKVPPDKAIQISRAFQEVLGKEWGEYIEESGEEVVEQIKKAGWMEKLEEKDVTEEDVKKAVYESKGNRV